MEPEKIWVTFTADVEVLVDVFREFKIWAEQIGLIYDHTKPYYGINRAEFEQWLSVRIAENTRIECMLESAQMTDYCSDDHWRIPVQWDNMMPMLKLLRDYACKAEQQPLPGM